MSDLPTISVIVVSRHRAEALRRAVLALGQSDHPRLELVVVADPDALAGLPAATKTAAKTVAIDEANISAARNLGIAQAAGEVIAFLDDDAVPEPTWASRLAAAFHDPQVVAATGFVRGRNGFSFQWQASEIDQLGRDHPLDISEPTLLAARAGRAVKTQGTNCAFRAHDLRAIGGFDPAYRFYLDEADLNLRMAGRGLTAIVPLAQVHHGFAASARRRADRVPLSLHEIGASSMVFLRRHAPERLWAEGLEHLRAEQRRRALRLMVEGRIEPRDVERLLASLEAGLSEGGTRPLPDLPSHPPASLPFHPLPGTGPRPSQILAGRSWQRAHLEAQARAATSAGAIVTVIRLSPTTLRHQMRFHPEGWWEQSGGLFGASDRRDPAFRWWHFAERITREVSLWAKLRPE